MKLVTATAALSLLIMGVAVLAETPGTTANRLLLARVGELSRMHRVTKTPVKMDVAASFLCAAPSPARKPPGTPHSDYYCHVFVDEAGRPMMESGKGTYPAGTLIVKQKFADVKGKSVELYTLMRKMEPGYDAEHGDWEYSIVNRQATQVLARGRLESCIECHKAYKAADYVTRLYIPEIEPAEKPAQ